MRRDEARRAGLTLIESLVVVGVIGLLAGLLLPAAQSARESARRLACAGNLRQIALASHAYHDANGCLPPGRFKSYDRRHAGASPPCTVPFVDRSAHDHLPPFVEQAALHDAFNHDLPSSAPRTRRSTTSGLLSNTITLAVPWTHPTGGEPCEDCDQRKSSCWVGNGERGECEAENCSCRELEGVPGQAYECCNDASEPDVCF